MTLLKCVMVGLIVLSCHQSVDKDIEDLGFNAQLKDTCWRSAQIDENGIIWCVLTGNACFVTSEPINQLIAFFENLDYNEDNTEMIKDFVIDQDNIDSDLQTIILGKTFLKVIKSSDNKGVYGILDDTDNLLLAYSIDG